MSSRLGEPTGMKARKQKPRLKEPGSFLGTSDLFSGLFYVAASRSAQITTTLLTLSSRSHPSTRYAPETTAPARRSITFSLHCAGSPQRITG